MTEGAGKLVVGMASKDVWITRLGNSLAGALREYAKERLVSLPGVSLKKPYSWSDEVARLVRKAENIYGPKTITSTKFNRPKALLRSVEETGNSQEKVTYAFNYIEDRVTDEDALRKAYKKDFDAFDASNLLVDMLKEYSPEVLYKELQKALK